MWDSYLVQGDYEKKFEEHYLEEFPNESICFKEDPKTLLARLYVGEKIVNLPSSCDYLYASDLNGDGYREIIFGSEPSRYTQIGVYDIYNQKTYQPFKDGPKAKYKVLLNEDNELFITKSPSVNWNFATEIGRFSLSQNGFSIEWEPGPYADYDAIFRATMPDDTDLFYWPTEAIIGNRIEEDGHTFLPGWFGVNEYLDKRYEADNSSSLPTAPEIHVVYFVGGYPDTIDDGAITRIEVTDPEIRVCGLTLKSSKDEIERKCEELGGTFRDGGNVLGMGFEQYYISFRSPIDHPQEFDTIYLIVNVQTNILGVVY